MANSVTTLILSALSIYDDSCSQELAVSCRHLQHGWFLQGLCPMPLVVVVSIVIFTGALHTLMKNRPPVRSVLHQQCFCATDAAGGQLHRAGTVTSPYAGNATSICGGWNNPAKLRSSWKNSMLPNLATDRMPITTSSVSKLSRMIPGTLTVALDA